MLKEYIAGLTELHNYYTQYVANALVVNKTVTFIEINPYDSITDGFLFDWNDDTHLLFPHNTSTCSRVQILLIKLLILY